MIVQPTRDQLLDQLDRAEHRIARLEAQTSIRGRAVVMYRERAREAEARIESVRALHQRAWHDELDYCRRCVEVEGAIWPCPTIRTLDGEG